MSCICRSQPLCIIIILINVIIIITVVIIIITVIIIMIDIVTIIITMIIIRIITLSAPPSVRANDKSVNLYLPGYLFKQFYTDKVSLCLFSFYIFM